MSQRKDVKRPKLVDDGLRQAAEDESAWHKRVLEEHLRVSNPKLANALRALGIGLKG